MSIFAGIGALVLALAPGAWALEPRGPEDVLPAFAPSNAEAQALETEMMAELLRRYSREAEQVFVGRVLNTRHPFNDPVRGSTVTFEVKESWRGRSMPVVDVFVPPEGDYVDGDPAPAPLSIVAGYTMLVFLDGEGQAIASNALFLVAGGFAWRNKHADVFLAPARDRDWVDGIDPSGDYVVYPLDLIQATVAEGGAPPLLRRRGPAAHR